MSYRDYSQEKHFLVIEISRGQAQSVGSYGSIAEAQSFADGRARNVSPAYMYVIVDCETKKIISFSRPLEIPKLEWSAA